MCFTHVSRLFRSFIYIINNTKMSKMINVQLKDLTVCVDQETAELLKDSNYADKYLTMVKHAIAEQSPQHVECTLWKSSHPTEDDNKATLKMLSLRKSMDSQFNDKKTHKNELWKIIAEKMNEMGFYVGSGVEGREKVRQKFANLHAKYIKYCDARKTTGQGKLKIPKFYEEMEDILGDKHKVNPIINIDSLKVVNPTPNKECSTKQDGEIQSPCSSTSILDDSGTSNPLNDYSTPSSSKQNRFTRLTTRSRPKSSQQNCLQELVNIQKENQTNRKEEFKTMMEFFQSTNNQRHEQIMALIKRGQKRKLLNENEGDSE